MHTLYKLITGVTYHALRFTDSTLQDKNVLH